LAKRDRYGRTKAQRQAWWRGLTTEEQADYRERKVAERMALRADAGPAPEELTRTKFPFAATINKRAAIVWPDWIEYPEDDLELVLGLS